MDHHHQGQVSKPTNCKKESSRELRKSTQNALKVKYISSPMRVKASASQFRSLVQQLTGKNSDVLERCMPDSNSHHNGFNEIGDHGHGLVAFQDTVSTSSQEEYYPSEVLPSDVSSVMHPYHMDLLQSYQHQT